MRLLFWEKRGGMRKRRIKAFLAFLLSFVFAFGCPCFSKEKDGEDGGREEMGYSYAKVSARDLFLRAFNYAHGHGVRQDLNKARELYAQASEAEYAPATYNLGHMCLVGEGGERDPEKAFLLFQKAAEQGLSLAQYSLASLYETGEGTKQDLERAGYWYEKAAMQGDAHAQFRMGLFYEEGMGRGRDVTKARIWYEKAAQRGHAGAQNNLANLFLRGEGGEKNAALAVHYYHKAALQGHAPAQRNLSKCYALGIGVRQNEGLSRTWEMRARAKSEREKKQERNEERELQRLARALRQGGNYGNRGEESVIIERPLPEVNAAEETGEEKEEERGFLANLGQGILDHAVSAFFERKEEKSKKTREVKEEKKPDRKEEKESEKEGILPQEASAAQEKSGSVEVDDAQADRGRDLYRTGYAYELGLGKVRQNFRRALRFYKDAAKLRNVSAQFRLGLIYARSPEMDPRGTKAFRYFHEAALQGHAEAQHRLALCYQNGLGTEQDKEKAVYWEKKARDAGYGKKKREE